MGLLTRGGLLLGKYELDDQLGFDDTSVCRFPILGSLFTWMQNDQIAVL